MDHQDGAEKMVHLILMMYFFCSATKYIYYIWFKDCKYELVVLYCVYICHFGDERKACPNFIFEIPRFKIAF